MHRSDFYLTSTSVDRNVSLIRINLSWVSVLRIYSEGENLSKNSETCTEHRKKIGTSRISFSSFIISEQFWNIKCTVDRSLRLNTLLPLLISMLYQIDRHKNLCEFWNLGGCSLFQLRHIKVLFRVSIIKIKKINEPSVITLFVRVIFTYLSKTLERKKV